MSIARGSRVPIERVLLEQGKITPDQLKQALAMQQNSPEKLERILVSKGFITEREVMSAYAQQMNVTLFDPAQQPVDPTVAKVIPDNLAQRYTLTPVRRNGNKLVVAMKDPTDVFALDDLRMITGLEIEPMLASTDDIAKVRTPAAQAAPVAPVNSSAPVTPPSAPPETPPTPAPRPTATKPDAKPGGFGSLFARKTAPAAAAAANPDDANDLSAIISGLRRPDTPAAAENDESTGAEGADEAPIIRMVNVVIQNALKEGASDVHVEADRKHVRIRYRIDGVLYEKMTLPRFSHAPLLSRLKIMAEMNIAERRIPQDGRIHIRHANKEYDMRVSVLPTVYGEKCVMRILDQSRVFIGLSKLGFSPAMLGDLETLSEQPNGMILATGPTGSGKTTTLYAILNKINSVEKNITTVEDPVEYQLPGVNQVSVNRKSGLTFPVAMRSFLRQDPDIIMVGEVRDLETAEIAVQAALTGHLVLTTLHTNDAPSTIVRLTDMGIEPFLISASIIGVIAQRLGRRLCDECKQPVEIPVEALLRLGMKEEELHGATFFKPTGCEACSNRGFRGRIGVYELLKVNEELTELIVRRAPLTEISQTAIASGMTSLLSDGLYKARQGITTIEEVLRCVRGH